MPKSLYVTVKQAHSGKSAILLGLMQLLVRMVPRVAFFKPVIRDRLNGGRDHDIDLLQSQYNLDLVYEDTYAFTFSQVKELIKRGDTASVLEKILIQFKKLEDKYDFVLCLGSEFLTGGPVLEFDLNAEIAVNLASPVILVTSAYKKQYDEIINTIRQDIKAFQTSGLDIIAVMINRWKLPPDVDAAARIKSGSKLTKPLPVYILPESASLGRPTIKDVMKWLDADVLYGRESIDARIDNYIIAAMRIRNFLDYLKPGSLVITPGDRSDILLGSLISRLSSAFPNISGILLTGGLQPETNIRKLIEGLSGFPVPILSVKENTYDTTQKLNKVYGRIDLDDQKRIATAVGLFESHVDVEELSRQIVSFHSPTVTPKMFEYRLIQKAGRERKRVVLPEGNEERILRAADILLRREVADIILLGNTEAIQANISRLGLRLDMARIIQPDASAHLEAFVRTYFELRRHKGIVMDEVRDRMCDATYFGTMMVHQGLADAMVSGSITTTAHTIRPAFEIIRTRPEASLVSSLMFMCLRSRVLVFGDCAINPDPDPEQLAEIAITSAKTAEIFGIDPRVAMLSYATGQSGRGHQVDKVVEATRIARERAPHLLLEGPLQYDAAFDPVVARTKSPESRVAGRATIFVFPDLNTGNNTYKAVQRAADVVAIGPVLQGLNRPVNDLSRGCTVADIVNTVAITAIQAQNGG